LITNLKVEWKLNVTGFQAFTILVVQCRRNILSLSFLYVKILSVILFWANDGSGSKIFDPALGQFLLLGLGRVSHLCFGFGFGFGKFPLNIPNFSFFALRVKKISSGQVKNYPGQSQVGLFFNAGPISILSWLCLGIIRQDKQLFLFKVSLNVNQPGC